MRGTDFDHGTFSTISSTDKASGHSCRCALTPAYFSQALNANGSAIAYDRTVCAWCALFAMADVFNTSTQSEAAAKSVRAANGRVLKETAAALTGSSDPRSNIKQLLECIASWFEATIHDDDAFATIRHALWAPVFVLNTAAGGWLQQPVSLWTAVQFLTEHRSGGMPLTTAVLMVLASAVGNLVVPDAISGPFVLCQPCQALLVRYYRLLPLPNSYDVVKAASWTPTVSLGARVKTTKIITQINEAGRVRQQNGNQSSLVETRLVASLAMLALWEALHQDTPAGVTAHAGEGRKDMRRLWLISLQTLPYMKNGISRHPDGVSFLIERNATAPSDNRTTSDNVEKPWKSVLGGAVISTLFFPIAGVGFLNTVEELDQFEMLPQQCMQTFTRELLATTNQFFAEALARRLSNGREVDYARRIFAQQRALLHSFGGAIQDCGCLWESTQSTFSLNSRSLEAD